MKKMLKLLCAILVVVSLLPIRSMAVRAESIKVAIVQLVSHPSLDDITSGIKEGLEQGGYKEGENLTINFQNAEGDMSLLANIAELVVAEQPDLIFAITTPVAQSLQQATSEIPIILAGITDPVSAKLVDSFEKPGHNLTGVSDAAPLEQQFELIGKLTPDIKKIGMLYTSSEDNSKAEVEKAAEIAKKLGLEVGIDTIASTSDMALVAENLVGKVDALFIPTDNTVASSVDTLLDVADKAKIPVYPTFDAMVQQGGLASVAINQAGIGRQSATMALEVLKGKKASELPIQYATETVKVYNSKAAEKLNIEISEELVKELEDLGK